MQPGTIGSLSSTSRTGRVVRSCSAGPSRSLLSIERCCTIATGNGKSRGSARRITRSALKPPSEHPIAMSAGVLRDLSVELFTTVDLLVILVVLRRSLQGLLATEGQDTEPAQ